MKPDHIPMLSYVFIGITSLVLTYATIADTTNEVILPPTDVPETTATSMIPSVSLPEVSLPSFSDTVDKLKTLNPFSTAPNGQPYETQSRMPVAVAVPVNNPSAPVSSAPVSSAPAAPAYGGNRRTKHKKRKQIKPINTRKSNK